MAENSERERVVIDLVLSSDDEDADNNSSSSSRNNNNNNNNNDHEILKKAATTSTSGRAHPIAPTEKKALKTDSSPMSISTSFPAVIISVLKLVNACLFLIVD